MDKKRGNSYTLKPSVEVRDLQLLEELEKNPFISQRELSHKFNIALGVINACIKRMVRNGWIRIRDLNPRKIGYYLTPKGLMEKGRLTFNMVSFRIQHYVELKKIIGSRLLEMQNRGLKRLVFYGISDELEVAYITLQGVNLKLVGIVEDDDRLNQRLFLKDEVRPFSQIQELNPDCILITSLSEINERRKKLENIFYPNSIYIKDICF